MFVKHFRYSPDVVPCDFFVFPTLKINHTLLFENVDDIKKINVAASDHIKSRHLDKKNYF